MNQEATDRLHWQAFQYVSGELTASEAESFERRLADDQLAREAVAGAVEICEGVLAVGEEFAVAAERVVPAARSSSWLRPAAWMALGAAACLAFVGTWYLFARGSGDSPVAKEPAESKLRSEEALLWAEIRQEMELEELSPVDELPPFEDEEEEFAAVAPEKFDGQGALQPTRWEPPGWMVAGAGLTSADSGDAQMDDGSDAEMQDL